MAKTKKKKQGFGESQVPPRAAKRFMIAFGQKKGDEFTPFLTANLEKLNESLLEALPLVFEDITKGKDLDERRAIAAMFGNFGVLLWQFPRGIRWLNLELSIRAYELALRVFTPKAFPKEWATTQMNLGAAYRNRIRGDRAENLETAIAAYDRALEVFTREDFPQDWANTQIGVGVAYSNRIRGDRAENLETSIAAYDRALEVFTREDFPQDWANTQGNLGLACSDRLRGDKSENIEKAVHAFRLCSEIYTQEAFPEDWARTQHNLADAYLKRVQGNVQENIEQAISLYNQAAAVFTQSAYPHEWFRNQAHLASAYLARADLYDTKPEQLENLNTAIALLQEVLATADPDAPTPDYIDAQYQLGKCLSRRHELTKDAADLQQALKSYKIAYEAISPEHYDREKMWQALPETQTILGSRLVRDGEWHKGLELLQSAVSQLSPRSRQNPRAYAYALYQIGRTHEVMSNWKDARIYYRDALRFYEYINDKAGMARCHHGLGAVLGCQGALEKSGAELAKAQALYQELGIREELTEVEELSVLARSGLQEEKSQALRTSV